ncbi:MAG: AraC family transcriptional regulator [Pseudomonadota bacterium]
MIEHIQSNGLEIVLSKTNYIEGETWTSTVLSGLWCGALVQGAVATVSERHGRQEWSDRPDDAVCKILLKTELVAEHVPLRGGAVMAAFVRIVPEALYDTLGPEWMASIEDTSSSIARIQGTTSATLAWQMLGCPLHGPARRLYLTGKSMELVSMVMAARIEQSRSHQAVGSAMSLGSNDIRRLYEAQSILVERFDNPPTVPELARSVGLNVRKLGFGFKELFGSSVYAFIKNRRLEHAHLLLQDGDMTVAQAAYACGYRPSHFSAAFRQRFGVPPSTLVANRKRPL